jgi:hypothetical protein
MTIGQSECHASLSYAIGCTCSARGLVTTKKRLVLFLLVAREGLGSLSRAVQLQEVGGLLREAYGAHKGM